MFQQMDNFVSATTINLSMGYYHMELDKESQKLYTTVLPDGKYCWARFPMGIACGPDIFQEVMTNIFSDLDFVLVFLGDVLIIQRQDETEEDHLKKSGGNGCGGCISPRNRNQTDQNIETLNNYTKMHYAPIRRDNDQS